MRPTPFVLLFSLLAAMPVFSQALSTGNQHVAARVESMTGLVTIRVAPGGPTDPVLTGAQKSFLYVMLGDRIFTNNNTGINIESDPRFGGLLLDGVNQKIGDTVRTIWANKNSCDVIQDVYPVNLASSGQIVIKWSVKNNSPNTPIWGQAQFLFDIHNPNTDAAAVLTRYGYRPIWEYYTDASTYKVPPLYASFEHQLPNAPGTVSLGYTQDVNYKLGLTKPMQMTIGDWGAPFGAALADNLWGVAGDSPWGANYQDAAVLLQWEGKGIGGNKTAEIARTSYGTHEGMCNGEWFLGLAFYPRHFEKDGVDYEPEVGIVEFYTFNTRSPNPSDSNFGPPSANTYVTLLAGPNIRIVSPGGNQKVQRQLVGPAVGYIPQYGVGTAFWEIAADRVSACDSKIDSWLTFVPEGSIGAGVFDSCTHPLVIDCISDDTLPPIVGNIVTRTVAPFHTTVDIFDNRILDSGIETIAWIPRPGTNTDPSKFKVEVTVLLPCSKEKHLARVTQLDTTVAGCFDFTIADCAGNDTTITICMTAHPAMPGPDTVPPVFTVTHRIVGTNAVAPCNGLCDSVLITELRPNDAGIKSITVITPSNMQVLSSSAPSGSSVHAMFICVVDSTRDAEILIRATDSVGNYSDTIFCYTVAGGYVHGTSTGNHIELIGNPASTSTTLRITLADEQSIKLSILDMSGRVVSTRPLMVIPVGVTDVQIPLDELSAGTYYIVAEWDGRQYAKKLSVVK